MQSAAGQRLHLRLFMEGIEVPIISAAVRINVNAPATASLQIVPSDGALNLRPRTMVHVFFWDSDESVESPPTLNANKPTPANGGVYSTDDELKGYKILFCGELIGLAMQKSPSSRQMVLQCSDFSTYWDTTYQILISYSPSGNFLWEQSSIWAGGSSLFDNILSGHGATWASYLNSVPKTKGLEKVQGLMGSIIALLEAMGGVPKHSHGVNDFFTIGEIKNHIIQQIVCEQNDDTAKRLFSGKQFWQWLMGGGQSLGELCTFRDMLMLLFKYIFYEVVPNPCAMYVPAVQGTTVQSTVSTGSGLLSVPSDVRTKIQKMISDSARFTISGVIHEGTVLAKALEHRNAFNQFSGNPNIPKPIKAVLDRAHTQIGLIARSPGGTNNNKYWIKETALLSRAINFNVPTGKKTISVTQGAQLDRLQTQIFRPDCFFVAPPQCNVLFPDQYLQFSYNRAFLQEITRLRLSIGWFLNPGGKVILGQTCFAPAMEDIRANAKKQGLAGLRGLLPWEIYTGILPKFEKTNEINYVSNKRDSKMRQGYKGQAVQYSQRVANFNYMKYRFAARSCEVLAKFNPRLVCGFPALVIDRPFIIPPEKIKEVLAAQSTQTALGQKNKDDFLSRFKILMDKLTASYYNPPTQYLGQIAALSHSVDQKGGYTSVTLTHAHTHRINDDDFLSLWAQQISKQKSKYSNTSLVAKEIIDKGDYTKLKFLIGVSPTAPAQPKAASPTPVGTRPTNMPNTTNVPAEDDSDPYSDAFMLFDVAAPLSPSQIAAQRAASPMSNADIVGDISPTTIAIPGTQEFVTVPAVAPRITKGPKKGKILAVQLGSDALRVITKLDLEKFRKSGKTQLAKRLKLKPAIYVWESCVIWENVPSTDNIARDIPVEESLRPPWFSPLYSSLFIGDQIYTPFFGCNSIVDEAVFAGAGTVGIFGSNKTERDKIMAAFASAGNDQVKVREVVRQAQLSNIADIPSVEQAVDALAYLYGEVRRLGLDVHRFVADYTYRPIATMYDIFGSANLEYEVVAGTAANKGKTSGITLDQLKLKQGTPGFHSTAIAPYGDLLGLLDNPDLEIQRLTKSGGKSAPVDKSIDPRPGRRERVQDYADELEEGHGVIGSALRG